MLQGHEKEPGPGFTLVCGHLSSRVCLHPEPFQDLNDHEREREQSISKRRNIGAERKQEGTKSRSEGDHGHDVASDSSLQPKSGGDQDAFSRLESLQNQTLQNQGAPLATDLSIIGFMRLDSIQAPPVISRHWITLDHPSHGSDSATNVIKDETMEEGGILPKAEAEDLHKPPPNFDNQQQHHQQGFQPSVNPNSAFQMRQQHHQQQHQHFQPNFNGHLQGMRNMPNMPPTSSKPSYFYQGGGPPGGPNPETQGPLAQQSRSSGKKTDQGSEPWALDTTPTQSLYSTLSKALEQESMVAIVSLQYPDKNAVRLRRWRHAQEEAALRVGTSVTKSSLSSVLSKRISHSQSNSPNPGSSQDAIAMGLNIGSSPSFGTGGSTMGGSSLSGGNVPKDDHGSALSMATLSSATECDREWYGLLLAAPHFLSSAFHSAPVQMKQTQENGSAKEHSGQFVLLVMPRSSNGVHPPWMPDMNHEVPLFKPRGTHRPSTRSLFARSSKESKRSKNEPQSLAGGLKGVTFAQGMEHFGRAKSLLREIRADLSLLCGTDPSSGQSFPWDRKTEKRIRHSVKYLKNIEAVYGYSSGIDNASKMMDRSLGILDRNSLSYKNLSSLIHRLKRSEDEENDIENRSDSESSSIAGSTSRGHSVSVPSLFKETKLSKDKKETRSTVKREREDKSPLHEETAERTRRVKIESSDVAPGSSSDGRPSEGLLALSGETTRSESVDTAATPTADKETVAKGEPNMLPPKAEDLVLDEEDIEEQDMVMEQSSVPIARRARAIAVEQSSQHQHPTKVDVVDAAPRSRVQSPGVAPQKRRRELRDDGSDDAFSAEGSPRVGSVPPEVVVTGPSTSEPPSFSNPVTNIEQIETERSISPLPSSDSSSSTKKSAAPKRSKRVKVEPSSSALRVEEQLDPSHEPLSDGDEGEDIEESSGRVKLDTYAALAPVAAAAASSSSSPTPPLTARKPRGKKQAITQETFVQHLQSEPQRPLPQPTFSNQHQRTPSGTPAWLAANSSSNGILANIRVPSRSKKTSVLIQHHQDQEQLHQEQLLQEQIQQEQFQQEQFQQEQLQQEQLQQEQLQQEQLQQEQLQQEQLQQEQLQQQLQQEQLQQEQLHQEQLQQEHFNQERRPQEQVHQVLRPQQQRHHQQHQEEIHHQQQQQQQQLKQPQQKSKRQIPSQQQPPHLQSLPANQQQQQYQQGHQAGFYAEIQGGNADRETAAGYVPPGQGLPSHLRNTSISSSVAPPELQSRRGHFDGAHDVGTPPQRVPKEPSNRGRRNIAERPDLDRQEVDPRQQRAQMDYEQQEYQQYLQQHQQQQSQQQQHSQYQLQPDMPPSRERLAHHGQQAAPAPYGAEPPSSAQGSMDRDGPHYLPREPSHLQQFYPTPQEMMAQEMAAASKKKAPKAPSKQALAKQAAAQARAEEEAQMQAQYEQQYMRQQQQQQQQHHHHNRAGSHVRQHSGQSSPMTPQLGHPPPGVPPGRRSAPHSRNNSASGSQVMMMMSPITNPQSMPMDHPRMGSPGAGSAGQVYHHPPSQSHSRSRGSSPSPLGAGYNVAPTRSPMPISAPAMPNQRMGTHSRNSSFSHDQGPPTRGPIMDPYMSQAAGPGGPGGPGGQAEYMSQSQQQLAHQGRSGIEHSMAPHHPSQLQHQPHQRLSQDMGPAYGHRHSHSQDLSGAPVQPPPRINNRSPSEAYQVHHGHSPSQSSQFQTPVRHPGPPSQGPVPVESQRGKGSRQELQQQQWYQEEAQYSQRQGYPPPQQSQHQHQHQHQQQGYSQPYPSQVGQSYPTGSGPHQQQQGYPSSSQPMYPQEGRHPPSSSQLQHRSGPLPSIQGQHDPNAPPGPGQGQGQGSGQGQQGSGGNRSRISLSSLLN